MPEPEPESSSSRPPSNAPLIPHFSRLTVIPPLPLRPQIYADFVNFVIFFSVCFEIWITVRYVKNQGHNLSLSTRLVELWQWLRSSEVPLLEGGSSGDECGAMTRGEEG